MGAAGDGGALALDPGERRQADPGDDLGEDQRLLGELVAPGQQSGGGTAITGGTEDRNEAVLEHQQEALALELGAEIEILAQAAALDGGDRPPGVEDQEQQGGNDAGADVGGDQRPGSGPGDGEDDAGGVEPAGAGDIGHGQAAEVEMALEHGGGDGAKSADKHREREGADQPGVGGAFVDEVEEHRAAEEDQRGGGGGERGLDGEDGAEIALAGLVFALQESGGEAQVAELLDDPGDEGDGHDEAENLGQQEPVQGDVAAEGQDAHAALAQSQGGDAGNGAAADFGRAI